MTFTALLEPVNSSSTQVPLFMPRTMQPVYSHEDCFVCRHPDGCAMSVAGEICVGECEEDPEPSSSLKCCCSTAHPPTMVDYQNNDSGA